MVELAGITAGDRGLDVGCGLGRLAIVAEALAGPAGEAGGIDPAPEMVELARQNAARAGVRARFEVGAIEALPGATRLSAWNARTSKLLPGSRRLGW